MGSIIFIVGLVGQLILYKFLLLNYYIEPEVARGNSRAACAEPSVFNPVLSSRAPCHSLSSLGSLVSTEGIFGNYIVLELRDFLREEVY